MTIYELQISTLTDKYVCMCVCGQMATIHKDRFLHESNEYAID